MLWFEIDKLRASLARGEQPLLVHKQTGKHLRLVKEAMMAIFIGEPVDGKLPNDNGWCMLSTEDLEKQFDIVTASADPNQVTQADVELLEDLLGPDWENVQL